MDITSDTFTISIHNLKIWQFKTWVKYTSDARNLLLKMHYDQLLIISGCKVLESINCYSKIKGIYKEDNLLLIIGTHTNEVRKIKFQIKDNVTKNLHDLGQRIRIINYSNRKLYPSVNYSSLGEFISRTLENKDMLPPLPLPTTYNNFIKLCLLDPVFPKLVILTQEILSKDFSINK